MDILYLNNDNFDESIKGKTVLLVFYAHWCPPCKALGFVLEEFVQEVNNVTVAKVNIDEEKEITSRFEVHSVPTIVLLKDGEIIKTDSGFRSKESLKKFVEL